MSIQQTLIIVKPDGIAKGLVGKILQAIKINELKVIDHARAQLNREWAENLYNTERNEIYFTEVVEWISSAPVLFLKIEGIEAVNKVKWQIIGRYPEGIRGLYSENWIKNVAHASNSIEVAKIELRLAEEIFKKNMEINESHFYKKIVFALTGMSECGKSTVGKYLDSKGINRLKIVKLFERVRDKQSPNKELYEFLKQEENKDPYALWDKFIDELLEEMKNLNTQAVSIESLYGGGFGPYLKQKLDYHFCIVYIDIPLDIRLNRQMQRENLLNTEDAKKYLLPRDEVKEKSGIPALKEFADEIVDNSGTIKELYKIIDALIDKYILL